MKLPTIATLLATAATSVGASAIIEARQSPARTRSSPGTSTNNEIYGTTTPYGQETEDLGGSGLFSHTRPATTGGAGTLYIANTNDDGYIIELRSGTTRNTITVNAGNNCQIQLKIDSNDYYRIWTY